MRIAMLAPISWRTPPRHYGPWELVTSLLTEALVARGVDVTLFATLDSVTAGRLAGVVPAPYSEDPSIDAKVWEILHVAHVFEQARAFDLIHNQADFIPLAFTRLVDTPVVTTIHGFSGVSATLNSARVALLTRASVAWADSATATTSVNGFTCSSSPFGSGRCTEKRRKISSISAFE